MTNYNERLDEILGSLAHRAYLTAHAPGYTKLDGRTYKTAVDEAKQAITSLIKELVAEAKPELRPTHIPTHGENTARLNAVWNMAIARYEQNLLKALEEV